jgi:hypothetical protein
MSEVTELFKYETATRVLVVSSIAFILLYAVAFFFLQRRSRLRSLAGRSKIKAIAGLALATALPTAGIGTATIWVTGGPQAAGMRAAPSILIEDMHRRIDVRSLPVLEIRDPF